VLEDNLSWHQRASSPGLNRHLFEEKVRSVIDRVSEYRQRILNARDNTPYAQLAQELGAADDLLSLPRMIGDAVIASFFSAEKPKPREEARMRFGALIEANLKKEKMIPVGGEVDTAVKELRAGEKPTPPFHWELEFPEVFTTDKSGNVTGGFDVIVGNPPFAGRETLSVNSAAGYIDWLKLTHEDSHGNSDLVAHFFRRSFNLLNRTGRMGLIATNTIAQGDTRSTGLRWICNHGGTIYRAVKRLKWPGEAAVVVSVVHIARNSATEQTLLNGRPAGRITAYLFHGGTNDDPAQLRSNGARSFQGCVVVGVGFTFDDTDADRVATPVSVMKRLIEIDAGNQKIISPYIGGDEVNASPTQAHHRYIINFGQRSEDECRKKWPDLMRIVEQNVLPERRASFEHAPSKDKEKRLKYWWQFSRHAKDLYEAIEGLNRVLVVSRVGQQLAFAFLPTGRIYADSLVVFCFSSFSAFCCLQSRVHEIWARFFSSSMKDDLRYAPSDCFDTFPFAPKFEALDCLEECGREYYEFRSALMVDRNEGLTALYNRFHDPDESSSEIAKLRAFHGSMDRAVLDAYRWTDIQPKCDFFPEFDDEESEDDGGRPKKKKYRYRWPDEIRDEILARLLELNRQRALEEGQVVTPLKQKKEKKKQTATPLFEE
jgi:hypothetical protein